jgi:hypothetical protein
LAKKSRKTTSSFFYIWRNFIIWAVLTGAGMYHALYGDFKAPIFERGLTDEFYTYTAAAFGIAVVYSYIAYANAKTDEKRSLALVLCAVNVVAGASYVIQILRLTPTFLDYVGHPVDPSRFLEWLATCPILYVFPNPNCSK